MVGAAGICLAVKLPRYFTDGKMVELQIYEKNPDVGGW